MHDFRCTDADDMFYTELAKHVKHFKETEGGMERMCKAMEVLKISDDDKAILAKKF